MKDLPTDGFIRASRVGAVLHNCQGAQALYRTQNGDIAAVKVQCGTVLLWPMTTPKYSSRQCRKCLKAVQQ